MEQQKLVDVPVSEAQREAEIFSTMAAFVRLKQDELDSQGSLVLGKMKSVGQTRLSFKDQYNVTHVFEVVDVGERLKYSKREK